MADHLEQALRIIQSSREGVLQSELWKLLGVDSRKCSRIVKKLLESGLIERIEFKGDGIKTYTLRAVKRSVRPALILAGGELIPCICCDRECVVTSCNLLLDWMYQLAIEEHTESSIVSHRISFLLRSSPRYFDTPFSCRIQFITFIIDGRYLRIGHALRRVSRAISPVIATMLLVGLTVILSALVYLIVAGLPASIQSDLVGGMQYIEITAVYDQDDEYAHALNYDSRVLLTHKGTRELGNDDLRAVVSGTGCSLDCRIDTMNGVKIQSTVHTGLSRLYGPGSQGKTWAPGETLTIDLSNGTLHPGDKLRI